MTFLEWILEKLKIDRKEQENERPFLELDLDEPLIEEKIDEKPEEKRVIILDL